jgi:hypothetical protein
VSFRRPSRKALRASLAFTAVVAAGALATTSGAVSLGPVSSTPASYTPQLANIGTTQIVRQMVQCGNTIYAVGQFSTIQRIGTTYTRNNIFSFNATSPYQMTTWDPNVNGEVNSIGFNGSDCSHAYIGGTFSSVGGTAVHNIAEVDTATGAVVPTFAHTASAKVETVLGAGGHILVGGYFKTINGSAASPYMTSLDPTTGKDDGFLKLAISGNYSYANTNATRVYNQQLSNSGLYDLVEGDFTSVGGLPRQQIFMLDLSGSQASVTGWTSPEWDGSMGLLSNQNPHGYPYQCVRNEPFYIQSAAWSPDDSTVYIADTGYHPNGWPTGSYPRTGLCDAAAAFPATINPAPQPGGAPGYVLHTWVNYTGCDSYYSVAADANTVYVAGHERWASNPNGCDYKGSGAIAAPGMVGLSPANGSVVFNPTRGRGLGASGMTIAPEGLLISSDNKGNTQSCGGVSGHAGVCLLPY